MAPILAALADPDIVYLLFVLGVLGVVAELHAPGMIVPGLVGTVALVLAVVGFAELSPNWGGLALIGLGIGLVVLELHVPGFGLLGIGGLVAFAIGSLVLFDPPDPELVAGAAGGEVSRWLVAVTTAAVAAFGLVTMRAILRARRGSVRTGIQSLVGREAVVTTPLAPGGIVRIDGELWSARTDGSTIAAGEDVQVVGVDGVTLHVRRALGSLAR